MTSCGELLRACPPSAKMKNSTRLYKHRLPYVKNSNKKRFVSFIVCTWTRIHVEWHHAATPIKYCREQLMSCCREARKPSACCCPILHPNVEHYVECRVRLYPRCNCFLKRRTGEIDLIESFFCAQYASIVPPYTNIQLWRSSFPARFFSWASWSLDQQCRKLTITIIMVSIVFLQHHAYDSVSKVNKYVYHHFPNQSEVLKPFLFHPRPSSLPQLTCLKG
jgi:hypothetical protein